MGKLEEYEKKRDKKKTPEPFGGKSHKEPIFVIQKHDASNLHYDLRLEKGGVLKSWAVPKKPPKQAGTKRLAVQTEDHPLGYASFEGKIPEGEYGAGTVELWDRGKLEIKEWKEGKKIEFALKGDKLDGTYFLVKFDKGGETAWLFFKKKEN